MSADKRKIASFKEKLHEIEKVYTDTFYRMLYKYSLYRIKSVFNINYNTEKGIRGVKIEDLISETIESFLKENGRKWYKDKFPDFKKQFISALDSVIYNFIKGKKELEKENRTWQLLECDGVVYEDNSEYEEMIDKCYDVLEELDASDEEILLFEPYLIHGMKRRDLEKEFGISSQDLTNIKKRLDRKIPLIQDKLRDYK